MPDILTVTLLGKALWLWLLFLAIVGALLAFDLGVLHRKRPGAGPVPMGIGASLKLSAFYVAVSLAFGAWVWWSLGQEAGVAYLTGFMVEKVLALDNVFVISMIFGYFAIPPAYQHRVLVWGVLGVLLLRGVMIALGAALIEQFAWILFVFGAFLVFTGAKMLLTKAQEADVSQNPLLRWLQRRIRVTDRLHGERFVVRLPDASGRMVRHATPLLLALVLVELADLVFAVDSIPAVFAITTDPYLVYTSNIFAILGLRALYFAVAAMVHRFHYLRHALALVLVFIGGKIFWAHLVSKPDPVLTLAVTVALLGGGVLVSLWRTGRVAEGVR